MDQELYRLIGFEDCNLGDPFFDSLKEDYDGFENWFMRKSNAGEKAYVSKNDSGSIRAFLYIKDEECEKIGSLPAVNRIKIGALKISHDSEGQRLGEGAIGLALWKWQRSAYDQIYLTVFPKHEDIIGMVTKYGFTNETENEGGESVYVKDKNRLQYDDSGFKAFPYLRPDFKGGKCIPIEAEFHDKMFPYSTLMHTDQKVEYIPVSNGIVKNYIATPAKHIVYRPGDVALIYRKSPTSPGRLSAVTSFCTISSVTWVKHDGDVKLDYGSYVKRIGNKTVYTDEQLKEAYRKKNVYVIEIIYNGYLGTGNNVNYNRLHSMGLFDEHPYMIRLTHEDVLRILKEGGKNEDDIIIHKSRTCDEHIQ